MTKYIIYADDDSHPGAQVQIKKTKREFEAISFIGDFKNLQRYGCMSVVMNTDDGEKYVWDADNATWKNMED